MTAEKRTEARDQAADELDIIELVIQLWRSRWLIGTFIFFGLVLSGSYAFLAPEKWRSTAIVTRPDGAQVAAYTHALSVLQSNVAFDPRDAETQLINRFASAFSALAETLGSQQQPELLTIDPVAKGQPLPLKLSYQAQSAAAAQAGLTDAINKIESQIASELTDNLRKDIRQKTASLKNTLATQEKIAGEQKTLHIDQIKEALKFAQAANLTQPRGRQGEVLTQDTLFLLGTEALTEMIRRESQRPLVYPEDYFFNRQQLLAIKDIKTDNISISTYRYILKPTLPVRRDSPKTALVLILGVLLGGMIGCGVVLGRNSIREYKARH